MTTTKFIITAAALSSLLAGSSANGIPSIHSIVAASNRGFFLGMNHALIGKGWNIATTIRGGSTGECYE